MSILSVEIMRPGKFGLNTSATLAMPATQAEFRDAMEKARITDDRVIYSSELLECGHNWLRPHIAENVNLLELNLLAARMENYIKDDIDVFEAMVIIEARRNKGKPIPIHRLINLTFSIDNCYIAGDITNDTQLGEFLLENELLMDWDTDAIQARIDSGQPVSELLTIFGKEYRENRGGILTATGLYVEYDGSLDKAYASGKMPYFERPGAPVVLEVSKRFFNTPGYDNDQTVTINLPLARDELNAALEKIGAASLKECSFRCVDCLIPASKTWIDASQDIKAVSHFAHELNYRERHGGLTEYKAQLEAIGCNDLDTALRLTEEIDAYKLSTEYSGPEDYGYA